MYICMCLYFHPTGFSQWALSSFPAPAWNSTRFVFTRHIFLGEDIRDNCLFFLLLLFGISYWQSLSLWVQIKTSSSNPPIDGEGGMRVNPCIGAHPTATAAHRVPAIHLFLIIISIRPAFPCNGYWILDSLFLIIILIRWPIGPEQPSLAMDIGKSQIEISHGSRLMLSLCTFGALLKDKPSHCALETKSYSYKSSTAS